MQKIVLVTHLLVSGPTILYKKKWPNSYSERLIEMVWISFSLTKRQFETKHGNVIVLELLRERFADLQLRTWFKNVVQ